MDPTLLVGDIVERDVADIKKPSFPTAPPTTTGFPQHKKRWTGSAFKQRRTKAATTETTNDSKSNNADNGLANTIKDNHQSFEEIEKKRIDQENRSRLDAMTPQEIAQAQEDLMNGLNPALVQRLLQRARIDEPTGPSPFDPPPSEERVKEPPTRTDLGSEASEPERKPAEAKKVSFQDVPEDFDEDREPAQIPDDLMAATDLRNESTHFPGPPKVSDLDPADPNFLENLHKKYFPDLPADPSKLAWMAPIPSEGSVADQESSYYPHPEIAVSALRFDFRGRFLSPRVSRAIPSSRGLHHHGEAPEAAGYTVAELARLARSAVPSQRCMAFQTLGRILFRLGRGDWGVSVDDTIAMGVWRAVKEGRVLDTLNEAAMVEGGHRGSKAYAMEALWLFEKGGWKEKVKGR
ncbi:RNA polymerase II-associated protein 1 [Cordyceps fumosorosea ARSEF 2679]|uniref:RNA polymerase II-associated protein 1 n=1 Tax=Cordyceps fumosorosea (strain ARSEF 2679) TaxID=1081104 RepID=A0A162JTP1_CORFA|nr:RNA polymerase II-associated protein 1 [Cordyceps fumosorosea ARSEF 2679]OAA73642.1 RNA polymerase II-associated protein 1 [Cordyceps fumosorosea ARSEF 2679]